MEIPRNIRQIGDIEQDIHLYMEDYVATFIEKLKRKNDTCVGIFLGKQAVEQEIPCLFVRGAVLVNKYEVEDGRIVMTASSWNDAYEQAERCFKDVEICGWFLCSRDSSLTDIYNLQKSHNENFKGPNQVLFLYDGGREEESLYRFDFQGVHRLRGYYIYYERNEQMQEYMISMEPPRKSEFALIQPARGTSDQAARQFRTIMESKRENTGTSREHKKNQTPGAGVSRFLRTVTVTALLCGVGFGMASWYRYDQMQGVKDVLAVLAGADPVAEETLLSEESHENGKAVVSEVPGNVQPTEKAETTAPAQETTTVSETASPVQETTAAPETTAETSQPAQTEAAAPVYQEYVVKSGDTLHKICKEIYGESSSALISEICSLNGMDNADFIFEGQTLKLPGN